MFEKMHYNYGISSSVQKNYWTLFYINGNKVKRGDYYNPSDGTSVCTEKELAMKKSYSEYQERFLLGVGGYDSRGFFVTYGETKKYGFIDTTGTATGFKSSLVINKALSELIEKNELLYFWYTDIGDRYKINFTQENFKFIRNLNFLANEFIAVAVKNFSNYYTVITLSRFENQITGCGISCSDSIETALNNALVENKLIEWQNFKNNASKFYDYTSKHIVEISQFIDLKFNLDKSYTCNTKVDFLGDKDIILREDILTPEIILLNNRLGKSKTIKIVSKYFLNCIPSKEFIELSKGQGILQDININLKDFQVDCFIV